MIAANESGPRARPAPLEDTATFVGRALAGEYTLERELGRGGMGVVFLARDLKLDRPVALKVLPPSLAADPVVRERFLREARTAAQLSHPHVVPVYRADEADGVAFFTMAFVDGESLGDRVRARGPLPPAEAVRILREVAWALAYAHARGVVHRDVKPENILLERAGEGRVAGRALVTDFGIARREDASPAGAPKAARLTQDGHVLGTLHFMSPEQALGAPVDGRSDLYALGTVAYYVLGGRLPFGELDGPAVLVAHATRPTPPLRAVAPAVPAALAAVVDRCLAKRPEDRYATGEALADALERALAEASASERGAGAFGPALPRGLPAVVSEEQAAALWRRAAQLQADALHRLEARRDLLTRGGAAPGAAGAPNDTPGEAPNETGAPPAPPTSGYRLADVAAAAEEAGISGQYVLMALAELPRGALGALDGPGSAGAARLARTGVGEREATRFLGTEERSLGVSYVVPAPAARVLRALGAVLQQAPYELQLRETVGAHPLDGGVIVFDLTGPIVGAGGVSASTVNFYWMGTHQQLEARQLQVTMRSLPGQPDRTELTMTCDLRPGVRRNVRASQWIAGVVGGGSGLFTGAVLANGAAVAASLAVLGPAAAVALSFAGASVAWYRWLYPSTLAKARGEMLRALQAVAAAVHSEDVFGALPGPGRSQRGPRGGDDGGATAAIGAMG